MKASRFTISGWVIATALFTCSETSWAQDTAFVYQGELVQSGIPAAGTYDFLVSLYETDLGDAPLAADEIFVNQSIGDGVFNLDLDFGPVSLTATALWLEISVREAGQASFTLLSPRWQVTPAARALVTELALTDSVDSASIAQDSITTADIQASAIDRIRLGINSVQTEHIQDGAVATEQFAPQSVGSSQIALDAVGNDELAPDSVGSSELANNAVASSELAPNSVGQDEIATDAVTASELAANAVTGAKIADNAVGTSELGVGSVGQSEIISSQVQRRVTGTCPSGQAIRQVNSTGTVTCESDSRGLYGLATPALSMFVFSSGNGSETENMGSASNRICWLSRVEFRDLDNTSEFGRCQVFISGGDWVLEAFVTDGRDGRAVCDALCSSLLADP